MSVSNNTIEKKLVFKPLYEKSLEEESDKLIFDWIDNHEYNKTKNCFIDINNNLFDSSSSDDECEEDEDEDDNEEYTILYGYDNPIDDIEDCDRLLKIHNSKTTEIAHEGNGIKKFSYKHNGELEIFSITSKNKYLYVQQNQNKIYEL